MDTRYEDCEGCGERYHDADIRAYIREVEIDGETVSLCTDCVADRDGATL